MKLTREQWLTEISDLMLAEIFAPLVTIPSELRLKLSVGFPPNTRGGSVIGVCFPREASSNASTEIFISPVVADSMKVLEVLAHELIHAIDNCKSGHRGFFASTARAIGLEGALTATYAGESLKATLQGYIDLFGDIPHAQVSYAAQKRQTNRNLLCACACGFKFRTARAQIDHCLKVAGFIMCPACTSSMTFEQ